jgi:hypothetical protein
MNRVYRISETQLEAILGKKQVYNDGYKANRTGSGLEKNPHESGTPEHEAWKDGWLAAEAKSQADHDDAQLSREIGEGEEVISEAGEGDNVFTNEIKSNVDIDIDVSFDKLFPAYAKPGTRGNTIIVDGVEFDPYMTVSRAITKYAIEVEYRSYGIKGIYVSPIAVSFVGTLEMTGDTDTFEKDFELEFDRTGVKTNTLSGTMTLGDKSINIADIGADVVFETERTESNGDSIYVSSVDLILQPNKIVFKY